MGLDGFGTKAPCGTQQTRRHPPTIDTGAIGDMQAGELGAERREQRPRLSR